MGAMNEAAVAALELEKVRTKVPLMFEREGPFYANIEKKEVEKISKRDMRIPLALRTGGYFGHWNPNGGSLGRGGAPVYDKALVNTVDLRYAIEWTTLADWAANGGRKAVINGVKKMVADAMKEFRRNCDSLALTNGSGQIGTVSAVSNAGGFDTVTLNSDGFGARLIRNGQKVTYYLSTLAATRHATEGVNTEVTFHDLKAKQIKTATTTGLAPGDVVVVEGLSGDLRTTQVANAIPKSIQGIAYHHSDASTGYWQGMDRSLYPEIRANRVNANGQFALPFARLAVNQIGDRLGQDALNTKLTAWMHPCQVQVYEEQGQLVSVIQKQAKEEGLNMYFNENMQMAGAPVRKHFSWDKKRIDFVTFEPWGRAEMKEIDVYEVQGRTIFEARATDGSVMSSQMSYIVASFQIFHENPGLASYIDGLTVPAGY